MAKDFQQPDNENYLSPVGFKFVIQNLPNVQWFVQSINIPALSLGEISTPSPLLETFVPGTNLVFEPLNLTFIVDEDLGNWVEMYNWLTGLSAPQHYSQYKKLKETGPGTGEAAMPGSRTSIYSDASLVILNSNMKANHQIIFKELFPTMLSALEFNTVAGDIDYITATATFRFSYYTYEKI
jgi:hypothetical protein